MQRAKSPQREFSTTHQSYQPNADWNGLVRTVFQRRYLAWLACVERPVPQAIDVTHHKCSDVGAGWDLLCSILPDMNLSKPRQIGNSLQYAECRQPLIFSNLSWRVTRVPDEPAKCSTASSVGLLMTVSLNKSDYAPRYAASHSPRSYRWTKPRKDRSAGRLHSVSCRALGDRLPLYTRLGMNAATSNIEAEKKIARRINGWQHIQVELHPVACSQAVYKGLYAATA